MFHLLFPLSHKITVQWEVTPVTASQSDYTPMRGTVTFAPGQSTRPLPLAVIDDSVPEFDEMFTVRLVGVVGSAILGDVIVSTVTIEANDDPNGALGKSYKNAHPFVCVCVCSSLYIIMIIHTQSLPLLNLRLLSLSLLLLP